MSMICDLCRKELHKGRSKWVGASDGSQQICLDCVKICKEIVNDPSTGPLTYLNEYKEMKQREAEK